MLIDRISKFGAAVTAGYHRVGVKVSGTSQEWTSNNTDVLAEIKQSLDANGIGYENIAYETVYGSLFGFTFTVIVIAQDGQNDSEVAQLVLNAVSPILANATASIVNASAPFANSNLSGLLPNSLSDLLPSSVSGIAGISVATIAILALGIGALFLLKPTTIPRRLR